MITQFTLENGLRVVLDTMKEVSSVAIGIWVKAGTLDENDQQAGLAHLLEHMAFKGTSKRSARDIAIELENAGASLDAATSHQRTTYSSRVLKGDLDKVCDLISDILIDPVFDNEELSREKEVVIQEIAEAADDPDDIVFELLSEKAWGPHPLGKAILGTQNSVRAHTPQSLTDFMNSHYSPDRMILSIAGNVEVREAERLANTYFSQFSNTNKSPNRTKPRYQGGFVHEDKPIAQSHLAIAYPGFGYDNPDYIAGRLFADVLGGGMSSRLFQKIREEHGLAYSVYAYADIFDNAGLIGAFIGTDPDQAQRSVDLMVGEIRKMSDSISEAELDRAKRLMKSSMIMSRESVQVRAEINAGQIMTFNEIRDEQTILDRIMNVSVNDIQDIGTRLLAGPAPSLSVVGPLHSPILYENLCNLN